MAWANSDITVYRYLDAKTRPCYKTFYSLFVNHAGSDPKNQRLAAGNAFGIPQNTSQPDGPFFAS
jgi:hypothetical protein